MLVANASVLTGCGSASEANSAESVRYLPVSTLIVEQADGYTATNRYSGEIVPQRTSELGFERGGRLEALYVREGSRVAAGDPIALMDPRRVQEQLRELAAAKSEAEAVLAELTAGPRSQELRVAVERVNELRAELSYARANRERLERLVEEDVGTVDDLERARSKETGLSAALAAAQQGLDKLNEGSRREQIQAQQARVEQLAARTALLQIDMEDSTLRAPYDGTIAACYVDEGSVLAAARPLVRLVEDGAPTAWIGMPFAAAETFTTGDTARVAAVGGTCTGTVSGILPQLHGQTRTASVVFDLEAPPDLAFAAGQVVRVDVERRVNTPGVWLPTTALLRGLRGLWACLVVTETRSKGEIELGLLQRRDVEVLYATASGVYVRGMLDNGERVVAQGTHRVVPGQWVELLDH